MVFNAICYLTLDQLCDSVSRNMAESEGERNFVTLAAPNGFPVTL